MRRAIVVDAGCDLQTERKIRKLPNFRFVAHDSQQLLAGYAWLGACAALRLRVHAQAEYVIQDTITDVEHVQFSPHQPRNLRNKSP